MPKDAKSLGHPAIKVVTNRALGDNLAFYERAGFAVEREEEFRGGIAAHLSKLL